MQQFSLQDVVQIASMAIFVGGIIMVTRYLQIAVDRICERMERRFELYDKRFENGEVRMERLETVCKLRHEPEQAKGHAR